MKNFLVLFLSCTLFFFGNTFAVIPSFQDNLATSIENESENEDAQGRIERMYKWDISAENTLQENIKALFYPSGSGGQIWGIFRYIGYALLVLALIYTGWKYISKAEDEANAKEVTLNLLYIGVGAATFFGSIWLLDIGLNVDALTDSKELVATTETTLLLQVLSFLKAFAFFFAIVMVIRYGYQILSTVQKEEKFVSGRDGVLNVLVALVFIKVIDYIYYVAQSSQLKEKAAEMIVEAAKMLAYILGGVFIITIMYAGLRLLTDGGRGDGFTSFKRVIASIFLSAVVIFLFLLIMYQVVHEFV